MRGGTGANADVAVPEPATFSAAVFEGSEVSGAALLHSQFQEPVNA